MRKLSPTLYFAYPASLALKYALATDALALAVAATMRYRREDDNQSQQLASLIAQMGVAQSVQMVTGITDRAFIECVEKKYREFY